MQINLVSSLQKGENLNRWFTFNMTVAWFLGEALQKKGVDCRHIRDHDISKATPPPADHTIVFSAVAMHAIKKNRLYRTRVKNSTRRKLALYLDADYVGWELVCDLVFTVVRPLPRNSPKFVYAGWGADPRYCFPEQKEKAVYVDSLMYDWYDHRFNSYYKILERVMHACNLKVFHPLPRYHGHKRLTWLDMQKVLRKSHFFCCTALGESGLTRIEAATCGALLVVPTPLYMPRTMATLEHALWTDEKELREILNRQTNPVAISRKARVHTWDKVAERILAKL